MLRKLFHGFLFGVGFTVAMLVVLWVYSTLSLQIEPISMTGAKGQSPYEDQVRYNKLSPEEKVKEATLVLLVRFKKEDQQMQAYVEQLLTNDASIDSPYKVGDRIQKEDYYIAGDQYSNRNGVLVVYIGNPPKWVGGEYLYNDRIIGMQDMPLDLFIKKFNAYASN